MSRAEIVRDVAWMVNNREPGSNNLASYFAVHVDELSGALGCACDDLTRWATQDDDVVRVEVANRLADLAARGREERRARARARAKHAAVALGDSARWLGGQAFLDVDLLLSGLLADLRCKTVRFTADGIFDVVILRETMARLARVRRRLSGLTAWVDHLGLHIRWNGARGGCNWRPQKIDLTARSSVSLVTIAPPSRHRSEGSWVGHVLLDMALEVP